MQFQKLMSYTIITKNRNSSDAYNIEGIIMTKKNRPQYMIFGIDPSGKPRCRSEFLTSKGSNADNKKYIKDHLIGKFKDYREPMILEVETGRIIEKLIEEIKDDIFRALDLVDKLPKGYALKLSVKKELGLEYMKKLDNKNFVKILLLEYVFNGKSLREVEYKRLGVYSLFYRGGHIYGDFLHKFGIYGEHKEKLNEDDLNDILKKHDIFGITKNQPIKTSIEFFDLCKEIGLMIDESKSKSIQGDIDEWVNG